MSVFLGYMWNESVKGTFHNCIINLLAHDLGNYQRVIPNGGHMSVQCSSGRIPERRNDIARTFLAGDCEWLVMIDTDMGFEPDTIDRLIASADPKGRPVVGALCFGWKPLKEGPAGAVRYEPFPTLYRWVDAKDEPGFAVMHDFPEGEVVPVAGTGAACLLMHRSALEKVRDEHGPEWFTPLRVRGTLFSEDLSFCIRLATVGIQPHVDTSVKTSHEKAIHVDESVWLRERRDPKKFVVIPMKDRFDLTERLVAQLREQGQHEAIFVYDNDSSAETKKRLAELAASAPDVEVFDAADLNIHQMWNAGLDEATRRDPFGYVAILNNDITIGDDFLDGLSRPLLVDPTLAAVSPNYDGRPGSGVEPVANICANRYDGTGGLAGFAFMVRCESNYRFPEQLTWWYGDNDLVASIVKAGARCGIALDVTCKHEGSGTADWDDPEVQKVLAQDRAWFEAKWQPVPA